MTDLPATTTVVEDRPYRGFDDGLIGVYGYSYDEQAISQIRTVAGHGWVAGVSLMADNHLGYSMPIGGVAGYREMVSPSGVGYDIGCGVMGVRTALCSTTCGATWAGWPTRSHPASARHRPQEPHPRRPPAVRLSGMGRGTGADRARLRTQERLVAAGAGRAAAGHGRLRQPLRRPAGRARRRLAVGRLRTSAAAALGTVSRPAS